MSTPNRLICRRRLPRRMVLGSRFDSKYGDGSWSKARSVKRSGVRRYSEGKRGAYMLIGLQSVFFSSPLTGPWENVPRAENILEWSPGTRVGQP